MIEATLTADEMKHWLANSKPGAIAFYHEGLLARDRTMDRELNAVAAEALLAASHGLVDLTQRRIWPLACRYLIKKRVAAARSMIDPYAPDEVAKMVDKAVGKRGRAA